MVNCPLCNKPVKESLINEHIDSGCTAHVLLDQNQNGAPNPTKWDSIFSPAARRAPGSSNARSAGPPPLTSAPPSTTQLADRPKTPPPTGSKRTFGEADNDQSSGDPRLSPVTQKRSKVNALRNNAPLAERMRPMSLDDVYGQELVGPDGLLRGMLEAGKLPSMILWGNPGTGKTTIARLIANASGARFAEINSSSTGIADVKKIFADAERDLQFGRKTIIFCDEIHRFSKTQQEVFLGPVEAGQITLIAATTENPSFKVINALLSRSRTFTLAKLADDDLVRIQERALASENFDSPLLDAEMLMYLATFADGDARTALNLLELAMHQSKIPSITKDDIKKNLTKTLVYDRNGDQHYDNISALHKSIRGSDPNGALYYLWRMLNSGEDPLYIARRLIVVASEDIGLADNSMLPLATATYTACQQVGMPECRINLAHCVVAECLAPKSTRAYRGLCNVEAAMNEPGVAGLPIPFHLRNAPTKLMKEMGYGEGYKYNPDYVDGRVHQEYLPAKLKGRVFLEDMDFGPKVDEALEDILLPEVDD